MRNPRSLALLAALALLVPAAVVQAEEPRPAASGGVASGAPAGPVVSSGATPGPVVASSGSAASPGPAASGAAVASSGVSFVLPPGSWAGGGEAVVGPVEGAPAPAVKPEKTRYFYFGYDYGSQATYNPLEVFVNRGFDVLQARVDSRNLFKLEYKENMKNVLRNVANPIHAVSQEGWPQFLREEIFPISYTGNSARWVPNYTLHLIGGGMTYREMREWFEDHGWPVPAVLSATTLMAAALVNESLENKGIVGVNTDCLADLYVFDLGGIVLFSFLPANIFFSKYLIIADWSPPPAFSLPGPNLHNQGNYFAAKFPLPFYERLRVFTYFGLSTAGGLSYQLDGEYSLSAAAGARATRLLPQSVSSVRNDVQFAPMGGLFLDRNNSLLASILVSNVQDYFVNVNVFPGVVKAVPGLGLWAVVDRQGHPIIGVSTTLGFGLGVGK
jgi:hypothetical protein